MPLNHLENLELQDLEKSAGELLHEIAASAHDASDKDLLKLESIAERAAKIAFGADRADLLTDQMYNLIKWTDHLDDEVMRLRFLKALNDRPLVAPW